MKKTNTIGCCGIDCGLCPRFYTVGGSRCPGCCGTDFEKLHPTCSFVTCCVKKKGLDVCAECAEFPCAKFEREAVARDSFVTHQRMFDNQVCIKNSGLSAFEEQQKIRMALLDKMLRCFDDGKCKSFFCLACALLSLEGLEKALTAAERETENSAADATDNKTRARLLKNILNQLALEENIELKLGK